MIIRTPRRLHLGLIDPSASLGRRFGSLGVGIEGGYEVKIIESEKLEIMAEGENVETIEKVVKRMNLKYNTGVNFLIDVRKGIPRHVGLGSTTQLTLATALGIAKLRNIDVSVEELAASLGRGKNSGTGIYTFKYGGFVLDGGVKRGVPPLIVRKEFPEDWAFLLVIPELKPGPNEEEEKPVMSEIVGRADVAMEISHRILLGLLPALEERDIKSFGEHMSAIQRLVGKHFEAYQGGEFREDIKTILEFLCEKTYGCGQSSWGPTVYGLIRKGEFQSLSVEVIDFLKEQGIGGTIELALPNNRGAEIIGENIFLERLIKSVGG
ncbi:beta-ribofuranosylaminobenzene 5'-phosphate synthase family protein [Thermococcus sp.]